jgi:ubiquinone/menaquinone biosynthesis C-methylase UbiE
VSRKPEIDRLRSVFRDYANDPSAAQRWDSTNPGNIATRQERNRVTRSLFERHALWPPTGRILDVGCGTGHVLGEFIEWGTMPSNLVGVDVVPERMARPLANGDSAHFVEADAAELPFASAAFNLVLAFTLFSSVLDRQMEAAIVREIDRVLVPRGAVLWYDYRISYPLNRHTRGMSRQRINQLFPAYHKELRSVTLVPQLARRLGRVTRAMYPKLSAVPLFRTHYVGLLRKPN